MELPYTCFVRKAGFRTTLSATTIQSIFTVAQSCPGSSAAKESACNAGNPGLIPGWGRLPTLLFLSFPVAQLTKNAALNAGELDLGRPCLGRCPGEGKGYPTPVDCLVHGVAKSRTQLCDFHFHFSDSY